MINETTLAVEGIQISLCLLAKAAMSDKIALDIQLPGQGSVCTIVHAMNTSGQVERSNKKHKKECPDGFLQLLWGRTLGVCLSSVLQVGLFWLLGVLLIVNLIKCCVRHLE